MTRSRALWIALAAIYGLFLAWYDGGGGPLTEAEIASYIERAGPDDPVFAEHLRAFAEGDDGEPFFFVNLVQDPPDGEAPAVDPAAGLGQLGNLLSRGGHPVAGGEIWAEVMTYEGAPSWDRVTLVRYRSRRDFLEISTSEAFLTHAETNGPRFERVIKAAAEPSMQAYAGPRGIVFAGLVFAGLMVERRLDRRTR